MFLLLRVAPTLLACFVAPALEQVGEPHAEQVVAAESGRMAPTSAASDAPTPVIVIPALTPVSIEVLAALGSKTSKTGDTFPIRLVEPIMIGDTEAIPAGALGIGEIVHAKKGGGMGAAGELVLAARYLELVGGRRVKLRSLRLAPEGKSNINTVNNIALASAASPLPVAFIGFFISGGQATVPQGTIAQAKTAEAFTLDKADIARRPEPEKAGSETASINQGEGGEE